MSKVLDHSFYNPARGGHAPGDIRAAFIDALDAFEAWCDHEPAPLVDVRGQSLALGTVCGMVWNCTDLMAGRDCSTLRDMLPWPACDEFPIRAATYAQGARALMGMIRRCQEFQGHTTALSA